MNKIPTLFVRNPEDMRYVTDQVTPGCEWVLAGEGVPTRKYDGTCVMFDGEDWWARREVKPGKEAPPNFRPISTDENTGKTVGWEPIDQSGFARWFVDALWGDEVYKVGTYELIGPKVNGNPEGNEIHELIFHDTAETLGVTAWPPTFDALREQLTDADFTYEGIVWHHPDGRMAKLKKRDFPR